MVVALQNSLTKYVAREVNDACLNVRYLNNSINTGQNELITPISFSLGSGLRDEYIFFRSVTKRLSYGFNLVLVANKSLSSIISELTQCLCIVTKAKIVSYDKLEILQKNLNEKIQNINLIIKSANFDGKALLKDGLNADIQVGMGATETISIRIEKLEGNLFRNNAANALNKYLGAELGRVGGYRTQKALDEAVLTRVNFTQADAYDLDEEQLSRAIEVARNGNEFFLNLDNDIPRINDVLEVGYTNSLRVKLHMAHGVNADVIEDVIDQVRRENVSDITDIKAIAKEIERVGGTVARNVFLSYDTFHATLHRAEQQNIENSLVDPEDRDELIRLLRDIQSISLATSIERISAQEVILSALSAVRIIESDLARQKSNIVEILSIFKSKNNVIQQVADSYLKTDYVLTSQQLVEEINRISGSIAALQAGNKLQETVLKLLQSLH